MEGKPSAQSEVLSTLEKVFVQDIPVLGRIHLSLDCNQSSCPCSWKNTPTAWCCHHHASLLGLYWTGDEQCLVFLHTYRLELRPKSSILVSSDQRILFVTILESFRCFLANSMRAFHVSGHSAIKPRLVEGCSDGWLSTTFSHLPNASLERSHSDLWVLLYLSHQGSSPPIAQFGRTVSSTKGSGRPKRLPFKDYGGHCALRNLKCSRIFFVNLGQICALPQFCLWALQAVPLTSWFSFALTCTVSCKVLYRQVCGFPNQVQSV